MDAGAPTLPPLLEEWAGALSTGAPMPVGAADGQRSLEMVAACYRSHREGQTVAIAELRD